jgi:adenosylmethionine-8-amino-7-oxononanoate aminotransferase
VSSAVFYRDLRAAYESVVSAEGMYLRTQAGQRILDAVGGAGTVVIGHGVREITDAVARHGSEISFVYGATFTNPGAFTAGSGTFNHWFTYSGNPFCTFVGLQVLRYALDHGLFEDVAAKGEHLRAALGQVAARHPIVGDVRGLGLFAGMEFVADRATREPFPDQADLTRRVVRGARSRGVLVLPGVPGANYGRGGDHIHLSPPYIITRAEIDLIAEVLDATLSEIEATL